MLVLGSLPPTTIPLSESIFTTSSTTRSVPSSAMLSFCNMMVTSTEGGVVPEANCTVVLTMGRAGDVTNGPAGTLAEGK